VCDRCVTGAQGLTEPQEITELISLPQGGINPPCIIPDRCQPHTSSVRPQEMALKFNEVHHQKQLLI